VLDLAADGDRGVARQLIAQADIVVESFRPGVPEKLGIDYASVARFNPAVIYCSLTGFGNESALGRVPGHDLSVQGVAGARGQHPEPRRTPPKPAFPAADFTADAVPTLRQHAHPT